MEDAHGLFSGVVVVVRTRAATRKVKKRKVKEDQPSPGDHDATAAWVVDVEAFIARLRDCVHPIRVDNAKVILGSPVLRGGIFGMVSVESHLFVCVCGEEEWGGGGTGGYKRKEWTDGVRGRDERTFLGQILKSRTTRGLGVFLYTLLIALGVLFLKREGFSRRARGETYDAIMAVDGSPPAGAPQSLGGDDDGARGARLLLRRVQLLRAFLPAPDQLLISVHLVGPIPVVRSSQYADEGEGEGTADDEPMTRLRFLLPGLLNTQKGVSLDRRHRFLVHCRRRSSLDSNEDERYSCRTNTELYGSTTCIRMLMYSSMVQV